MKTLLLLRHAKSSWKQPALADHDRPLNKRGNRAAPLMGALLQDEDLIPDLILCSSAARTHMTAILVAKACDYIGEIQPTRELDLAAPQSYIEVLRQVTEKYAGVLVVGHHPGLESLLESLTGKAIAMPTAAASVLRTLHQALERFGYEYRMQAGERVAAKEFGMSFRDKTV